MRDEAFAAKIRRRQKRQEALAARKTLQADLDADPNCANAHVMAWRAEQDSRAAERAALRAAARKAVPKPPPLREVIRRDKPLYQVRKVPNPELDDERLDPRERARVARMIDAPLNVTTQVGGFARVKGRTKAQTEAVARYRQLWENSIIGGAKAIDYAQARVDTSMGPVTAVLDRGIDAREAYAQAVRCLGLIASRLLELVVCEGRSVREVTAMMGHRGDCRWQRELIRRQLLEAADKLVEHFRIGGPRRSRVVAEGEVPEVFTGEVSTRKKPWAA